jgi:DNA-binding GntR family transcriptional regulator
MQVDLPQVKRERASDSVFNILRESIVTQIFPPGQRLNVKDLAEKLGVSMTPVKEAINRLATEGLVEIRPRSGTFVTEVASDDVIETFELRAALECLAAEKALKRMTPDDVARLKELLAEMERPANTEKERAAHDRKNVEFHNLIIELSGNRKLVEIYRSLNAHIKIARIHYSRSGWAERLKTEQEEHRRIMRALETRNCEALVKALRQHIERGAQCLIEDLKKNGSAK